MCRKRILSTSIVQLQKEILPSSIVHVQEENLKSVNTESNGKVTYYSLNSTYFFNYVFGISDKMIEILCSCRRLHQYNEDDFLFQL